MTIKDAIKEILITSPWLFDCGQDHTEYRYAARQCAYFAQTVLEKPLQPSPLEVLDLLGRELRRRRVPTNSVAWNVFTEFKERYAPELENKPTGVK